MTNLEKADIALGWTNSKRNFIAEHGSHRGAAWLMIEKRSLAALEEMEADYRALANAEVGHAA